MIGSEGSVPVPPSQSELNASDTSDGSDKVCTLLFFWQLAFKLLPQFLKAIYFLLLITPNQTGMMTDLSPNEVLSLVTLIYQCSRTEKAFGRAQYRIKKIVVAFQWIHFSWKNWNCQGGWQILETHAIWTRHYSVLW